MRSSADPAPSALPLGSTRVNETVVTMPVSRRQPGGDVPRSPARSVQEIFASDAKPPPAVLLIDSPRDMGRDDVSLDRYYSREWHEREVRTVWQKT